MRQIPSALCLGPTGMSIQSNDKSNPAAQRTMTVAKYIASVSSQTSSLAHVLIIDEMSMLSARDFTALSKTLFSRLILIGDFYQLQPPERQYFFTSAAWKKLAASSNVKTWTLSANLRISDEAEERDELHHFLTSLRTGAFYTDPRARGLLDYFFNRPPKHDTTAICPTREKADQINTDRLASIDADLIGTTFKKGCRVQVTENIYSSGRGHKSLLAPNGKLGTLIAHNTVSFPDGSVVSVPMKKLRLGYAITVHGAQGLSLDHVHIVGPDLFEGRQHVYTAFSRARTLLGITVENLYSYDIDALPATLPSALVTFMSHYNL